MIDKKNYFISLVNSISRMEQTPLPFLCASTMIEYLKNMSGYNDKYIDFIKDFFPKKNKDFRYSTGKQDLPEQMYYILRCGLVHSFTLFPDENGLKKGARHRSILITHRSSCDGDHLKLIRKIGNNQYDSALFVLEDFCCDIIEVIQNLFSDSKRESAINKFWDQTPPISWLGSPS